MNKITCLIGCPRAGKSTFANNWIKQPDPDGLNRIILCEDDIRLALHENRYIISAEDFVHSIFWVMVRAHSLRSNAHLLLDETTTSIVAIEKVLKVDINTEFIYIDTPLSVCRARAIQTGQEDLISKGVIDRMYNQLLKLSNYSCDSLSKTEQPYSANIYRSIELIRNKIRRQS